MRASQQKAKHSESIAAYAPLLNQGHPCHSCLSRLVVLDRGVSLPYISLVQKDDESQLVLLAVSKLVLAIV